MSAPRQPSPEQVADTEFYWEHDLQQIEPMMSSNPHGSLPPFTTILRRLVSEWEPYQPKEQAP
jgi:hypothetical protein